MTESLHPDPDVPDREAIDVELAKLERMTAMELGARYHEEFGKPPRSRHRLWLLRKLGFRLQEKRLGGLSIVARRRLRELMDEIEFPEAPAPRSIRPKRPQAQRSASNSVTYAAALRPRSAPGSDLRPGTLITKTWRGAELRLTVREAGFELDGAVYRSLSAAAKAATGAHWNGRLFWFGRAK